MSTEGMIRVERVELGLYVGDHRIAPNREDGQCPTHVQQELFRTVLLALRLLGPNFSIRLPDGRAVLQASLPEDVAIDWQGDLARETEQLINLHDAIHPGYFGPAKWPTPPPAVVEPPVAPEDLYKGLSEGRGAGWGPTVPSR